MQVREFMNPPAPSIWQGEPGFPAPKEEWPLGRPLRGGRTGEDGLTTFSTTCALDSSPVWGQFRPQATFSYRRSPRWRRRAMSNVWRCERVVVAWAAR